MSSPTKRSIQLQTNLCNASGCHLPSEVICRHCHEHYCYMCFMCHRKSLLDDMQTISEQMSLNRRQGILEVVSFINKQAKDAHDQAKKLIDDVIDRILKASQNINTYIENRRLAKLSRLEECLAKFDKDAEMLNSKLSRQIFLPASQTLELRRKYAYNMFDRSPLTTTTKSKCDDHQHKNEEFFKDYRYYDELINLRQKWTFLQGALTTVYFPGRKDFSLDKIITFLEYRHDRVLENYREHLITNEEHQSEIPSKSIEELLNELSFLSQQATLPEEACNFSYMKQQSLTTDSTKSDSGHGDDDETDSNSSHEWQIEDGNDSLKCLETLLIDDFQTVLLEQQSQTQPC
ncbi:unnamed protein product [Adineta ricciae]|uniref:Uncharacterized protein n=1 Tax=Adineta ricciae TaxID=249248 RepID=A0A814PJ46_ADIRI|nr:unnamed protein product [Adineta ricciae]